MLQEGFYKQNVCIQIEKHAINGFLQLFIQEKVTCVVVQPNNNLKLTSFIKVETYEDLHDASSAASP